MPGPFVEDRQLTAIAIAVQNRQMIADFVLPRTSPLSKNAFRYQDFPVGQFLTVPDTRVGRRSRVNEVEFEGRPVDASTEDEGLEHPLPNRDIDNAPDNTNLEAMTTEWLTGLVLLAREVRTSALVFNPDTYGDNKEVVGASDRFDNADSDPVGHLLDVLDRPIMRPNLMTIGQSEWRVLRTHPKVVKAVQGNSGDSGAATVQQVAELLEIDRILVGRALVNASKPGQPAVLKKCWSGGVSLIYQDESAARLSGLVESGNVTFGFTAQTGQRVALSREDGDIGLRGGRRVRVGETVKEIVCAPSLGFFLKDVITPA